MDDLVAFALAAVAEATGVAARRFREVATAEFKADGTPVTAADVEVESLLRDRIGTQFPDDEIVGEELGLRPGTSGRRWVIDPINGTTLFVRRIPTFSMNVALVEKGRTVLAVTAYPMSDVTIHAARGAGCWRTFGDRPAERLRVSPYAKLRGSRVAIHNVATWSSELLLALHESTYLSEWQGTAGVAGGEIEAAVVAGLPMAEEDLAPIALLVEEAGGRVTALNGADVGRGDGTVLATNGLVHDAFLDLVRGLPTGRDYLSLRQR